MLKLLNKLIGSNERTITKLKPIVTQINQLESAFEKLSDADLKAKTQEFREIIQKRFGQEHYQTSSEAEKKPLERQVLDEILPEAFAAVREAAKRTIGQRPYDVQLIGGIVLHQGKIAEMKTGEGKTLVATLPLYLNSLLGHGAHLVTVNDFLAKFHAQWMGQIYNALGVQVAAIGHEQSFHYSSSAIDSSDPTWNHLKPVSRKEAYLADVTYGTNNEFGFDYLRDNMAPSLDYVVQRTLNYGIVDEVDSILIDEARTPLIISAPAQESVGLYQKFAQLVPRLTMVEDYDVDEKMHAVTIKNPGIHKIEQWLNAPNIYTPENISLVHHLEEALRAHALYKPDKDYVVKDGEIIIVDEFTGRLMHGRRYSEGLHQAIEAKEGVEVRRESLTMATISFQNFFRLYRKLAGMTGTAATESEEFYKIYGLEVIVIPTHRPMIRIDHQDQIYQTAIAKDQAVVEEIRHRNASGQPILVGTISIEKNELLSGMLTKEGIKHQVLNAKHHEREAKTIAQAGRIGAVTIATNIAGRGVDIILGGTPPVEKSEIRNLKSETSNEDEEVGLETFVQDERTMEVWQKEHHEVVKLGGLHVIGTERHESRRIDNQLRGRSGRQGDPGSSVFFVSMEDDLMRIFGGDRMKALMSRLGLPDNVPIEHGMISKSIEQAQKKVEGHNFDIRKHLVEYDDVANQHRVAIYRKRRSILDGITPDLAEIMTEEEKKTYQAKWPTADPTIRQTIEQQVFLRIIDTLWVEHLTVMDDLRTGIGLRGYAQRDPLIEYKHEAYNAFERLLRSIDQEVVGLLMRIEPQQIAKQQSIANQPPSDLQFLGAKELATGEVIEKEKMSQTIKSSGVEVTVRQRTAGLSTPTYTTSSYSHMKVGRNEPCPCGSGKKFKKCHGK